VYIGGALRSNSIADFLKLSIGRPHFLVHYPCKLFVLFWYFGCLRPVRPQHQQTTEGFWSKTIFKSKELFGRTEESDQRQRLRTTFRARSSKIDSGVRRWKRVLIDNSDQTSKQETEKGLRRRKRVLILYPRSNVQYFGRRQLLYQSNHKQLLLWACVLGGVLRSNPVTDFVKLRIGRPHFLVHYPCKLFVLFRYFGCLRPVRPQHQQTEEGFWSKTSFKSKELFARFARSLEDKFQVERTEESDQRQRLIRTFRARSNKIKNNYDGCEVQECSAAGAATFIVINEVKKVEYFLRVSRASLTVSLGEGRIFLFGFFGIVQSFLLGSTKLKSLSVVLCTS